MAEHGVVIRPATTDDADSIVAVARELADDGRTYVFERDDSDAVLLAYWTGPGRRTWVAEVDGAVLGMYLLRTNQPGRGSHVANASYAVAAAARGRGLGRRMGEHSLVAAKDLSYRALQFNLVVATNTGAIALWERLGFATVGRLPGAFRHEDEGLVDALVMHRWL